MLRTLSARILLGFAIVIVTFGGVTVYQVANMSRLTKSIRAVRTGYVPLALKAKELEAKQNDLRQYLDEIPLEPTRMRVEARLRGFRAIRQRLMREANEIATGMSSAPAKHRVVIARIRSFLGLRGSTRVRPVRAVCFHSISPFR
jgi:hypothetical protein